MVTTAGTVTLAAFTKSSPFAAPIPANCASFFASWKYEKSPLFPLLLSKYFIAPKVVAPDNTPTTAKGNNFFKLFIILKS